jgi:hypothetical protein
MFYCFEIYGKRNERNVTFCLLITSSCFSIIHVKWNILESWWRFYHKRIISNNFSKLCSVLSYLFNLSIHDKKITLLFIRNPKSNENFYEKARDLCTKCINYIGNWIRIFQYLILHFNLDCMSNRLFSYLFMHFFLVLDNLWTKNTWWSMIFEFLRKICSRKTF